MSDDAPGWDAIDAALAPVVGSVVPLHWGTDTTIPDQDGIWGVSAYALADHVLYATYGLTELFGKVRDDPTRSGWGAELTMRVPLASDVPTWPVQLLVQLGGSVFQRATMFEPGGRLDVPSAAPPFPRHLCWAPDPVLTPVDGPFGRFGFTTTVGVDAATIEQMRATDTASVLARLRTANPLLITR
jgi:hypothetical protein